MITKSIGLKLACHNVSCGWERNIHRNNKIFDLEMLDNMNWIIKDMNEKKNKKLLLSKILLEIE